MNKNMKSVFEYKNFLSLMIYITGTIGSFTEKKLPFLNRHFNIFETGFLSAPLNDIISE